MCKHSQKWEGLIWCLNSKIDCIYLKNKQMQLTDNCFLGMLIQIKSWSKVFLGQHDQKWVLPVWLQDFKIDCISKMNWWNKLIFCILVQIQESYNLIHWFLGGSVQKWSWSLSSWDPKICFILVNIWIELILQILIVV